MVFQYHFYIEILPQGSGATISAEDANGEAVEFDASGKTVNTYAIGTVIQNIGIVATGYEDDTVGDHTIAKEVLGTENEAQKTLDPKEVCFVLNQKFENGFLVQCQISAAFPKLSLV